MNASSRSRSALVFVVLVLGSMSGLFAITNGQQDTTKRYGYVPWVRPVIPNSVIFACSATVIAPRVAIAPASCVLAEPFESIALHFFNDPNDFFSPLSEITVQKSGVFINPLFGEPGGQASGNLAVLIMDEDATVKYPGLVIPSLPPAGLLDSLSKAEVPSFTQVGFGRTVSDEIGSFGGRFSTTSGFLEAGPLRLVLSDNPNKGFGGACRGDEGGAIIRTGGGADTVVAMIDGFNGMCNGANTGYRLDTEVARSFLSAFVNLP